MTTTPEERLVFFPAGTSSLAGVLTVAPSPNGRTVLLPWGAGTSPSSGVNRVRATLARALAAEGFHAFRFDFPGVGESDGEYSRPNMTTPFAAEVAAAADWLTQVGFGRIVVLANCFGAWSSLLAGPRLTGLEGVILVNPPVKRDHSAARGRKNHKLRRRLRKVRRAGPRALARGAARRVRGQAGQSAGDPAVEGASERRFLRSIHHLLDTRIPLLILYGDDDFRGDFDELMAGELGGRVERAGDLAQVVITDDRLAGFPAAAQSWVLSQAVRWLGRLPDTAGTPGRAEGV